MTMESPSRNKDTSSSSSIVSSLPELVNLIGHNLSPSELVPCLQVSRLWNYTLLPLVWHTINPKKRAWKPDKLEQWVRTNFVNNCHLVRDLTADWDVLLETAAGRCRNLTSLAVHTVARTPSEHLYYSSSASSTIANDQPPPPPGLSWIFNENENVLRNNPRQRRDMEWFWQLVDQNPRLVCVHFPHTAFINHLSQVYILETVSRIKNLRELNTRLMTLDLSTLLDTLPQLERLECSPSRGTATLSKNHLKLQQLKCLDSVQVSRFMEVLKHLPRLESLVLSRIIPEKGPPTSTYEILCETVSTTGVTFPQVRELRVYWMSRHEERYVVVMLGLFPELRRVWLPHTFVDVRKAMWEKCYWLEEINGRRVGVVDEWKERRAKDAAEGVRN
ncbi:hypothetical protein BGZ89_012204 [Linnemannia elongata]|nr:hypothetical protein BGZ89_012204 [Linnemannia elongata]